MSSDGQVFEVEEAVAQQSVTLQNTMEGKPAVMAAPAHPGCLNLLLLWLEDRALDYRGSNFVSCAARLGDTPWHSLESASQEPRVDCLSCYLLVSWLPELESM